MSTRDRTALATGFDDDSLLAVRPRDPSQRIARIAEDIEQDAKQLLGIRIDLKALRDAILEDDAGCLRESRTPQLLRSAAKVRSAYAEARALRPCRNAACWWLARPRGRAHRPERGVTRFTTGSSLVTSRSEAICALERMLRRSCWIFATASPRAARRVFCWRNPYSSCCIVDSSRSAVPISSLREEGWRMRDRMLRDWRGTQSSPGDPLHRPDQEEIQTQERRAVR